MIDRVGPAHFIALGGIKQCLGMGEESDPALDRSFLESFQRLDVHGQGECYFF